MAQTSVVSHARSDAERLLFMRGLQGVWRVHGRHVLAAFDLSPFPVVCDLGGEYGPPHVAAACPAAGGARLSPSSPRALSTGGRRNVLGQRVLRGAVRPAVTAWS